MKYYYLNSAKEPQGSYTREEMLTLLAEGKVTPDTLSAAAGDAEWKPLHLLLELPQQGALEAAAVLPAGSLGNCPWCGAVLNGTFVSADCPHCGKSLHAGSNNLFSNALYVLKRGFSTRGRATRTEYWSFALFCFLFNFLFEMLTEIFFLLSPTKHSYELSGQDEVSLSNSWDMLLGDGVTVGVMTASFAVGIILWIYGLCVKSRRLHDRGWSGWLLAAPLSCELASLALFVAGVIEVCAYPTTAGHVTELLLFLGCAGVLLVVAAGLEIWIFILTLLPSQRGANKYGPSKVYPLG